MQRSAYRQLAALADSPSQTAALLSFPRPIAAKADFHPPPPVSGMRKSRGAFGRTNDGRGAPPFVLWAVSVVPVAGMKSKHGVRSL